MKNVYDIIFIGGGLSSLMFLSQYTQKNPKEKILVLEKNKSIRDDQTFCAWAGPSIVDIAQTFNLKPKKKWHKIQLADNTNFILKDLQPYQYVAFDGNKTLKKLLSSCKNITYKSNITVKQIQHDDVFTIKTDKEDEFYSLYLFDSRPPKDSQSYKYKESLSQAFIGSEIMLPNNSFDETTVTLMDFQKNKDEIIFTYVLPFSKKRALVETTFFTKHVDFKLINNQHKLYLKRYKNFKEVRTEKAVLPMAILNNTKSDKILKLGIGAGMMRPSTGYSMQRMANWINSLRFMKIKNSNKQNYFYRSPKILDWLDSIFLKVCYYQPQIGPLLFMSLFKKANIFSIIRFMSDVPSWFDIIRIVWALPKKIMIKGLLNRYE